MIHPIHISPSELILGKTGEKNDSLAFLKKYQTVDARVSRVFSSSKAEVVIAGNRVIINTPFELKQGQVLSLNLIRDGSNKVFRLLTDQGAEGPQKLFSLLKTAVQSSPFSSLASVSDSEGAGLLKSFSLQSGKADPDLVSRVLEKSGMLFEKKITSLLQDAGTPGREQALKAMVKNDLKGMALEILAASGGKDSPEGKALSEFSSAIEKFQVINSKTADSGRYLIPFPVLADNVFSFGNLFFDLGVDESEHKQDKDRVVNVSLLLNMTALGALRADFSIFKKAVSGRFSLPTREIRDFVKAGVPNLVERLEKQEYTVHGIDCRVAEHSELTSEALVEKILKDSDGTVNIVI